MQIKTLLTRILVITSIFLGGVLLLGIVFYVTLRGGPESDLVLPIEVLNIPAKQNELAQPIIGLPTRLRIPKLNVDSFVEFVGVTPEGTMGIPAGPVNVAWFELGSRPGEVGSAVIAGHFGWKNGIPAVFDDLYKLRVGDKIYIEDDKGVLVTFVVQNSRRYDPKEDASGVFTSSDGKAHLNLVTCEGVWAKIAKSYSERLVVFADRE